MGFLGRGRCLLSSLKSKSFRWHVGRFFSICLIIGVLSPVATAQRVKSLGDIVRAPVKDCPSDKRIRVPIITWGGDIATIYANGSQKSTAAGSIFGKSGLNISLVREDVFAEQVNSYLSCQSPYLRGTAGMINMAAEVTDRDPRTKMRVVYQLTWSAGGDALVVKDSVKEPRDLHGKTIAVQAYGPHVDYLAKVLKDAGLSLSDVTIKWTKDLTGTDATPMNALYESGVDAAMVIIPDALALTSNGTVGNGAEQSVKGAKILLSTKSANRIIADVYAVREDYFQKNTAEVKAFVKGLLKAQEETRALFKSKNTSSGVYRKMIRQSAKLLLDSEEAVADTEAMYGDAEFAAAAGNTSFFDDGNYPRRFSRLTGEIQEAYRSIGLLKKAVPIAAVNWASFSGAGASGQTLPKQRFNKDAVQKVVGRKQQQGTLSKGNLFSFEVYFKPNQSQFLAELYQEAFDRVIELASTYGGAVITIEGHSDPLGYLKKRKKGGSNVLLKRIKQAAKNLSLSRANAVRDSLIGYAKSKGVTLDPSQFAIVGFGITQPKSGMCGKEPCAPKTEQEWLNNMRVEFRMIQLEAEESVFKPL